MQKPDVELVEIRKGEKFADKVKDPSVVAAEFGGVQYDLASAAPKDGNFTPIRISSEMGLSILRHSAAHLLAQAVLSIYPNALLNAGPPTEEGFYYDIFMDPLTAEELEKVEKKMVELTKADLKIQREEYPKEQLLKMFSYNRFKLDKIRDNVPDGTKSSVYRQGDFVDFCTGPHVPSTAKIRALKLLSIASTNYKGDPSKEKMVRIYGTAFPDEKSLKTYLHLRAEAMKRDHRKIGQEMDLFIFNSERAPGFPFYTPNGTSIRNSLIQYMRELNAEYGWDEVNTPHLFRDTMWKQSGHYAKYRESMYTFEMEDGSGYAIKPMNCPGHITIFERDAHSFRDLPIRYAEPGTVYRYEKSGEVGGLTRPRMFTIDDGHAFVAEDQLVHEISGILDMVRRSFTGIFGNVDLTFELSIMDKNNLDNYLITYRCNDCSTEIEARKSAVEEIVCPNCGSKNLSEDLGKWDLATEALKNALDSQNIEYRTFEGEAAFYGPKIDVHLKDALGRSWQLSTVQVDFNLPLNFDLTYVSSGGDKKHVVMIHRAIYGSYERLMAILIENSAGKLPTWLSPLQLFITPVSDRFIEYSEKLNSEFRKNGLRSFVDYSKETINKKIKLIRPRRPSYILVIGEREESSGLVTVRNRKGQQKQMPVDEFVRTIKDEIKNRVPEQPEF